MLPAALAALTIWVLAIDIPQPTSDWLDASWQTVLVEAHLHQRQFGREIAFTLGPWGFLTMHFYPIEGLDWKFWWEGPGKLALAAGIIALSQSLPSTRRWLFFLAFAVLGQLFADTFGIVFVTLAVVGGLMRPGTPRWALGALVVGMAFLAAVKFTLCLLALGGTVLAAASLFARGQSARALGLAGAFSLAFLGWWLAAGQEPGQLLAYFQVSREISAGYPWAMSAEESWPVFLAGVTVALSHVIYAATFMRGVPADRRCFVWPAVLFLCAAWGLAWKHGFTRADGHVLGFFYFCLISAIAVPAWLRPGQRGSWFDAIPFLCVLGLGIADAGFLAQTQRLVAFRWLGNVRAIARLGTFRAEYEARQHSEEAKFALPPLQKAIGNSTVDWVSYEQGVLLLNGLNYRPRPVFQSYIAYTSGLMKRNRDFLKSPDAPEFVIFRLQTLDARFPAQDDALLLAELPRRYDLTLNTGDTLLFRKKSIPASPQTFTRQPVGTASPILGEEIRLPDHGEQALWLQADFPLTRLGRLRALLYRPPILRMVVTQEDGQQSNFRVIPPIAAEGFLIQPFLETTSDYAALARGEGQKRLRSIRFEPARTSEAKYWTRASVRFFRVPELPAVPSSSAQPSSFLQQVASSGVANLVPLSARSEVGMNYAALADHQVLVVHAPGEVIFKPEPSIRKLAGEYGLAEGTYTGGAHTDGAEFSVECEFADGRRQVLWQRALDPVSQPADRGVQMFSVELPPETTRIIMRTLPGPKGDTQWDWTYWGRLNFSP